MLLIFEKNVERVLWVWVYLCAPVWVHEFVADAKAFSVSLNPRLYPIEVHEVVIGLEVGVEPCTLCEESHCLGDMESHWVQFAIVDLQYYAGGSVLYVLQSV